MLTLTGSDLTIFTLVAAARHPAAVVVSPEAIARMRSNRAFAERIAERGDDVYGLTTGVGVRKKTRIDPAELIRFNRRLLREHATGQGPLLPVDVARASAILLLNQLAAGRTNVRPELAVRIAESLSEGRAYAIRSFGSTGMGDVVPLADLVADLLHGHPQLAGVIEQLEWHDDRCDQQGRGTEDQCRPDDQRNGMGDRRQQGFACHCQDIAAQ